MQSEIREFLSRDDLNHYRASYDPNLAPGRQNPSDSTSEYVVFRWYSSYQERWHISALELAEHTDQPIAAACIASQHNTVLGQGMLWLRRHRFGRPYQQPSLYYGPNAEIRRRHAGSGRRSRRNQPIPLAPRSHGHRAGPAGLTHRRRTPDLQPRCHPSEPQRTGGLN